IGSNGLGQVVVAVAFSFLVRIFSAPGPALLPENDDDIDDDVPNDDSPDGETPTPTGKVTPVTIRWNN
ncbi:ABC transporter G family member 7-like, partial [Trifolium medium]|nr:ABC transporter G family member 7-like [Trifolium medium]